jgi:hypothetical protein
MGLLLSQAEVMREIEIDKPAAPEPFASQTEAGACSASASGRSFRASILIGASRAPL